MISESGPWILLHATRIAGFLFPSQAIILMFAMIKNRKVKLLKETRMSLYQISFLTERNENSYSKDDLYKKLQSDLDRN